MQTKTFYFVNEVTIRQPQDMFDTMARLCGCHLKHRHVQMELISCQ
jgi:hypothetical protein